MAEAAHTFESDSDRVWNEICSLGLKTYVADLDTDGYTVIPPEIASPAGLSERLLEACLDVMERRTGVRPDPGAGHADLATPTPARARNSPVGNTASMLLLEDPVFEEALMNPVLLAMVTHLCGYNVVMSSMSCSFKGPSKTTFRLHTDTRLPSPLPTQALVCKGMYLLTDYSRDNGATVFIPGSHKWCRNPVGDETLVREAGNDRAVPVEAAAGSLVVFHGNTWHGAINRLAPGLRVSVHALMVRPIIRTREDLIGRVPQEVLDRNPARFAILAQQGLAGGTTALGDMAANVARAQKYISAFERESGVTLPVKDSS